jgi:hypothetical protein
LCKSTKKEGSEERKVKNISILVLFPYLKNDDTDDDDTDDTGHLSVIVM